MSHASRARPPGSHTGRALRHTTQAEGVAAATGTTVEVTRPGKGYAHFRDNDILSDRFGPHLARSGIRLTQPVGGVFLGSSDLGDVSGRVPAIHPFVAILGDDASDHTPAFARAAASERGLEVMLAAAEALACTAADVLRRRRLDRPGLGPPAGEGGGGRLTPRPPCFVTSPADRTRA
ncbi:hypothetical protein [Streptomyces sp. NPDC056491]|uniref:hypothetical protein n=1 Tax=Streptomyces sp. NPDC056491 TaxID=3345837 RepID=UPI0036C9BA1B